MPPPGDPFAALAEPDAPPQGDPFAALAEHPPGPSPDDVIARQPQEGGGQGPITQDELRESRRQKWTPRSVDTRMPYMAPIGVDPRAPIAPADPVAQARGQEALARQIALSRQAGTPQVAYPTPDVSTLGALARAPLVAADVAGAGIERGLSGWAEIAGAPHNVAADVDTQQAQGEADTALAGHPAIQHATDLAGGILPFAVPGGGIPAVLSMGGNAGADALARGATPGQALTAATVGSAAGAIAPFAGKVVAPLAERVAAPVAAAAGRLPGELARGAVEGGAQGAVLGAGNVGALATYDPESAKKALADIAESGGEMALLGALARAPGGMGKGALRLPERLPSDAEMARRTAEERSADLPKPAEPPQAKVDDIAATAQAHDAAVDQTQRTEGAADLARMQGEAARIKAERERIDADIAAGKTQQAERSQAIAEPQTQRLQQVQDEESAPPADQQAIDDQKAIAEAQQLQDHQWRQEFISRMAAGRAKAQAERQADGAKDEQWRQHVAQQLRQARTGEVEKAQVPNPYDAPAPDPAVAREAAQARLGAVASEEDPNAGMTPARRAQRAPRPAPAPEPAPEPLPAAEPPRAAEAPAPAPEPAAPPALEVGHRVRVGFKGKPVEGSVVGRAPEGRFRVQADDGRTFPAVAPERITSLETPRAAPPPAEQRPVAPAPAEIEPGSPAPGPGPRATEPAAPAAVPRAARARGEEPLPPRMTGGQLREQLDSLPVNRRTPGLTDALMRITEARAKSAGLSLDDYVGRKIAGVRSEADRAALNQKDTLLQQQGTRLEVPGNHLRHQYLLDQWKRAHGDRSPTPTDKDWQKLVRQADMVDEAQGRKFFQEGERFPHAGAEIDGLKVGDRVANTGSIRASMDRAQELPGIRELSMDGWDAGNTFSSASDIAKTKRLAEQISASGRIDPLIVEVRDDGPYILEGNHRLAALHLLGKKSFPAKVVVNRDVVPEDMRYHQGDRLDEAIRGDSVKRGAVQFLRDGRAIIHAFQHADESTIFHELAHIFRRDLSGEDLAAAEEFCGVKDGNWTRPAEEKFARWFERYLRNGEAPTPELKSVFQKCFEWLHNVYRSLQGTPLAKDFSPAAKQLFDRLLTADRVAKNVPREIPDLPREERTSSPTPSDRTQAPSLKGPGSDRTQNSRAADDRSAPAGARPAASTTPSENSRPDLATPGTDDAARSQYVETRNEMPDVASRSRADIRAKAEKKVDADPEAWLRKITAKVGRGDALNAEEQAATQHLLERLSKDPARAQDFRKLALAYHLAGNEGAVAMGLRVDRIQTPEGRATEGRSLAALPTPRAARKMAQLRQLLQKDSDALSFLEQRDPAAQKLKNRMKRYQDALDAMEATDAKRQAGEKAHMKRLGFDLDAPDPEWAQDPDRFSQFIGALEATKGGLPAVTREMYVGLKHMSGTVAGKKVLADVFNLPALAARRVLEAGVAGVKRAIGKGSDNEASFRELRHMWNAIAPAFAQARANAWATLLTEQHPKELMGPEDLPHYPTMRGLKGSVFRHLSLLPTVRAIDAFTRSLVAHVEVAGQAYRSGAHLPEADLAAHMANEVGDFHSESWGKAREEAMRATFQERPIAPVRALNRLKYQQAHGAYRKAVKFGANALFPFSTIPSNIATQGLSHWTPGLSDVITIAKALRRGEDGEWQYDGNAFNRDVAQAALRWGGAAGFAALSANGTITGADDERNPDSINAFGHHFSYRFLGPIGRAIGAAADVFAPQKEKSDPAALRVLKGSWDRFAEMPMLRFGQDLYRAAGQQYEGKDGALRFLADQVASTVEPSIVHQALTAQQDDIRAKASFGKKHQPPAPERLLAYLKDRLSTNSGKPVMVGGKPLVKDSFDSPVSTFMWRLLSPLPLGNKDAHGER